MNLKVGDKVKVRSDLNAGESYGGLEQKCVRAESFEKGRASAFAEVKASGVVEALSIEWPGAYGSDVTACYREVLAKLPKELV